jgi:GNAT superfamily N-acetyltransferase
MLIRPSTYAELIAQAELVKEYAAECSLPEIGEVQPNSEIYAAMERVGVAQVFAAFDGEQMIGFAAILTPVMPHYSKRVASVESIFVTESARKSGIGKELMRTIEEYAKEQGCKAILYSAPTSGKLERLLKLCKRYRHTNTVFAKQL